MTSLKARRVRLYFASFFLDAAGHGYPLIVSAHAQYALHASPTEMGVLGAITWIVYSAVCLTMGGWSDRKGSMPLIFSGLLLLALVVLPAALLSASIAPFYFTNAGFGLCLALFWPPLQRELSLLSPGDVLWRALGAFNLSWALGAGIGTVLGGPQAYELFGFHKTVGIAIGLVSLACLSLVGPRSREHAARIAGTLEDVDPRTAWLFVRLAWIANFCASFAMGGIHIVFVYVAKQLELAGWWGTAILYAKEAGRLVAFAFLRKHRAWHYSFAWLAGAQLAGGAALVACGFVTSPWLLFLFSAVLGMSSGVAYYSSLFYGLNLRADEGRKSGLHEGILALGVIVGPVACGAVGDAFPKWPGGVLLLPGAVILAGVGLQLIVAQRESPKGLRGG
jgi:MFS family permease